MLSVVVFSHVVNDGVHRECLLLILIVSCFSSLLLYLRTAFCFIFYYFSFSFQNYFLLYFFSFIYVLFLVSTRTSNPPHLPSFVGGALFFFLCRGTNIYNFWGCARISRHVPRLLYTFYFLYFLKWILLLLVREKHRKTLYRFLLSKNKEWGRNNKDKNSETRQTDKK